MPGRSIGRNRPFKEELHDTFHVGGVKSEFFNSLFNPNAMNFYTFLST
jgi:hypothetical protein